MAGPTPERGAKLESRACVIALGSMAAAKAAGNKRRDVQEDGIILKKSG